MPDPLRLLSSPDGELPAAPCRPNRCTGGAGLTSPPPPLRAPADLAPLRAPADPAPWPLRAPADLAPAPSGAGRPRPPAPSSAPRRPRRPLCPGREQDRGVDLPFAGDPAQ